MNDENLVSLADRATSEQREIARKGGVASGQARLRKKRGRELLLELMKLKEVNPDIIKELEELGIAPEDRTLETAMHVKQLKKAIASGNTEAYSALSKIAGFAKEEIDINATVTRPRVVFEDDEDAVQDQQ